MHIIGPELSIQSRCKEILRSLPNWFGIEAALVQYADDTTRLPTFVAMDSEEAMAFLTLKRHFPETWEIHCMAVDAGSRQQRYGSALLGHAEDWLTRQGAKFLQVKTVSATPPDLYYAETRRFYERQGFVPVEIFPEVWDAHNPCLQLIKRLKNNDSD